ncbi:type VII secretion integral membrane protein EccD [Streptomyces sp. 110]|uniref:Type VII secretion integral membrane protein EccD n=1 Tax=Streptomyces endocoffeicus TaxID=2898945 RepID=A0ABS1PVC0_9ACTN|nr:type VII secretion integral membrane protein EccD [Streptomyces endocoffeicus]MBL1116390.1 type VII secretion integral membrane protein EccD [Streptomyces endocoffeicus]
MVGAAKQARSAELSRVTLVGERRRVDIVLPADEPVGRLLPDVLRLVDDQVADRPALRHLVTAEGVVLAQDATLTSAAVPDGAVLRLVRERDVPAAPVVHDVTDEVAEDLDLRAWRWSAAARQWTASAATLALALAVGLLARRGLPDSGVATALAVAAAAAALTGAAAARLRNRDLGATLMLTGGALGVLAAWTAADAHGWGGTARLAGVAGAIVVTLLLLGASATVGRGAYIGAGAVVVTGGLWEVVAALQDGAHTDAQQARSGAVLAVVSVVALGLLPRLALTAAGLTGLDDRRSGGVSVSRHEVVTALAATHRGLVFATLVTAASATAAGLLAVGDSSPWTVPLTAVLAIVLLSRSRAYPLAAEVVALLAAALVLLVRLVVLWLDTTDGRPYGPLAALAVAALLPLGVLTVRPPEHVRVRLRRIVDLVEAVGVIVLFPLVVGEFGVYGRLLDAF